MESNHDNDYIWGLIAKSLSDNALPEEEQILLNWRNQSSQNEQMYIECKRIWDASGKKVIDFNTSEAWMHTRKRLYFSKENRPHKKLKITAYAIAAGVLVLLATTFFVHNIYYSAIRITTFDETRQIALSDGTIVEVNRNSQIEYPRRFRGEFRAVKLVKGEAFFTVMPDVSHPFVVETSVARVKVLGTRFNVCIQQNGEVRVLVQSGKVAFQGIHTTDELLLTRNEGAFYSAKLNVMQKTDSIDWNFLAWKTHRFVFREAELSYVYKMLNSTYGKTIKADSSVLHNRLTATFDKLSLDEILRIIDKTFLLQTQSINDTLFMVQRFSTDEVPQK